MLGKKGYVVVVVVVVYFLWSLTMLSQVVDKIRIQMDAFLEDGSHEATISVIRALAVAVPHSTDRLREYILLCEFHVYILIQVLHDL